jgi:hypothetical protein
MQPRKYVTATKSHRIVVVKIHTRMQRGGGKDWLDSTLNRAWDIRLLGTWNLKNVINYFPGNLLHYSSHFFL